MNSDARLVMRDLVRRLCESVAREMELRAQIRRILKELEEIKDGAVRH